MILNIAAIEQQLCIDDEKDKHGRPAIHKFELRKARHDPAQRSGHGTGRFRQWWINVECHSCSRHDQIKGFLDYAAKTIAKIALRDSENQAIQDQ